MTYIYTTDRHQLFMGREPLLHKTRAITATTLPNWKFNISVVFTEAEAGYWTPSVASVVVAVRCTAFPQKSILMKLQLALISLWSFFFLWLFSLWAARTVHPRNVY